ncbi:MAG: RNase adapter RapZ [Gammaproteobacteria bacterium]
MNTRTKSKDSPSAESPRRRLILISGLSGSGKSVALHMLEDLGYFCVDNIPAGMLAELVAQTIDSGDPTYKRTAVGIDARNRQPDIEAVPGFLQSLRSAGMPCEVMFLHADDDVLLSRYSASRRRHPLSSSGVSLRDAIATERRLLTPITDMADLIIDTSRSSVHQLREAIRDRIDQRREGTLSLLFESFAYRKGVPADADLVFDVRCLPNPYWEKELRPLTGKDAKVARYLDDQESSVRMQDDIAGFLDNWIEDYRGTNRSYLTVAIGCTGGRHRSVYMVEKLADRFRGRNPQILTRHNELSA